MSLSASVCRIDSLVNCPVGTPSLTLKASTAYQAIGSKAHARPRIPKFRQRVADLQSPLMCEILVLQSGKQRLWNGHEHHPRMRRRSSMNPIQRSARF